MSITHKHLNIVTRQLTSSTRQTETKGDVFDFRGVATELNESAMPDSASRLGVTFAGRRGIMQDFSTPKKK